MSVHHHSAHVVPNCCGRGCNEDADCVVAFDDPDIESVPFCISCANAAKYTAPPDLRVFEYPLEEFYTVEGENVFHFEGPDRSDKFELFNPDRRKSEWMSADNRGGNESSYDLEEWV